MQSLYQRTVFDIDKISFSKDNVVNLMVSLEAPPLPKEFKRNPVFIMAALDKSGSMSGDKIEALRQTMYKLIDNMTAQDSLGLVWFGGSVQLIERKLMNAENKEWMKNNIASTVANGGTPMQGGLEEAFKAFGARKMKENCIERLMLLTDGQATDGATEINQFRTALKGVREGITMSCFGYGSDYNESLLEDFSKDYSGNSYFVANTEMLPEAFAQELGSLLSCFCHGITISAAPVKDSSVLITSVLNDLPNSTSVDGGRTWIEIKAGDLFFGEKKRVFLRMKCPSSDKVSNGKIDIAELRVAYTDGETGGRSVLQCSAGLSFVNPEDASSVPDQEVAEQVLVLDAAKVQIEAKDLAEKGEWQQAKQICDQMIEDLDKYGTEYTKSFAEVMRSSSGSLNENYISGGVTAKCLSSVSNTILRGGRGMAGGEIGEKMKDFSTCYYASNDLTMSLVDDFTKDNGGTSATNSKAKKGKNSKTSTP